MKSSSARRQTQPEFDFGSAPDSPQMGESADAPANSSNPGTGTNISNIDFGVAADLYAVTSRRAGRLNAANIPETEVETLMRERHRLLDKKFDGTMTRGDEVRLKYIQWQLDTIDDARTGEQLDMLEAWVSRYEQFQEDLNRLHTDLSRHKRGTRR
jgi:hypothetical protein